MEITGKIIQILETRSGVSKNTGNSWAVAQYVLETNENYPRRMAFEVFGEEKITAMDIKQGELLTVSFDVEAHEYQSRWFNQIRAWKVERPEVNATTNDNYKPLDTPFDDLLFSEGNENLDPPF